MSSKSMVNSFEEAWIMSEGCIPSARLADVLYDVFASAVGVHDTMYIAEPWQYVWSDRVMQRNQGFAILRLGARPSPAALG